MKEKPRISYPHLNLVQSEVLQAQQKARAAFIQAARQTSPGTEGPEPDTRLPVDDLHINSTSLGD